MLFFSLHRVSLQPSEEKDPMLKQKLRSRQKYRQRRLRCVSSGVRHSTEKFLLIRHLFGTFLPQRNSNRLHYFWASSHRAWVRAVSLSASCKLGSSSFQSRPMPNSLTSKRSLFFPSISKTLFVSTFGRLIPPTEVRKSKTLVCKWLISRFDVCNCCVTWFLVLFELLYNLNWIQKRCRSLLSANRDAWWRLGACSTCCSSALGTTCLTNVHVSVAIATCSLVGPSAMSPTLSLPLRFYHVKRRICQYWSSFRYRSRLFAVLFFSPTHFGNGHSPFDTSGCLCCYQLFYPLGYPVLQFCASWSCVVEARLALVLCLWSWEFHELQDCLVLGQCPWHPETSLGTLCRRRFSKKLCHQLVFVWRLKNIHWQRLNWWAFFFLIFFVS